MKIFKIVFLVIGIIFLGISLSLHFYIKNIKEHYIKTTGVVVEAGRTPTILFRAKSRDIKYRPNFSCKPPCYDLNEKVIIYYNPDNPQNAMLGKKNVLFIFMMITLIIGGIFFLIGFGFFIYSFKIKQNEEKLKKFGVTLQTEFFKLSLNYNIRVNGNYPYVIYTKFFDEYQNKTFYFKSGNIWFNPKPYLKDIDKITVYVDSKNYDNYFMDLSFLPDKQ